MYFIRAIACWIRHAGHDYGEWRVKGSKGRYELYRICRRCAWVQMPERVSEG